MAKQYPLNLITAWVVALFLCWSLPLHATEKTQPPAPLLEPLPLQQLTTFAEVYNLIKSTYVEDVDDQVLLKGAIAGMLESIDPHSAYLNKASYEKLMDSSAGQYGGLGIEVVPEDDAITIITPIDNSPAKRAGILPGDKIVKINNTPLRNIKSEDAMELMRGELGETVVLSIRRKGNDQLLEFELIRELIKLTSVSSRWLGNGMAYVRITQFQRRTGYDLSDAIQGFREQHQGKIDGLILDLRNNPGGVLTAAQSVADAFLNEGIIFSTKGKSQVSNYQFMAEMGDVLYGAPLVVLINNGSASAAEIVAGALQDHNRAVIMGTRSFGKGSIQTLMPILGEAALKLTTARYFTPSGRSIQGIGIIPDIEVKQAELLITEASNSTVYESDLKGTLVNTSEGDSVDTVPNQKVLQAILANDYQLLEALNLLRGIHILSQKLN